MSLFIKNISLFIALFFGINVYSQQPKSRMQLEDVVGSQKFYSKQFGKVRSLRDGNYYSQMDKGQDIIKYSYETGLPVDTLFYRSSVKDTDIHFFADYQFNEDENTILFTADEQALYRHSFVANYWVFDLKKRKIVPLSLNGKQQLAEFSPLGDKIAFIRDNNIFIKDLNTLLETQVTNDGHFNQVINGKPDWVYEEEFDFTKGYEWSADGKFLAFLRFDESQVKSISLPLYEDLYPSSFSYKYPKAGESNSTVSVWVYQVDLNKKVQMNIGKDTDQYIPSIKWMPQSEKLCIVRMNRLQNRVELLKSDVQSGVTKLFYSESNKYFFNENYSNEITFLNDGKRFVTESEKNGYNHIYVHFTDGKAECELTKGKYDADKILGIDQTKGILYYTSCEDSPLDRMIYSVHLDGSGKKQLSDKIGVNTAVFSRNFAYYINTWSDCNTPKEVTLHTGNGTQIRILDDNSSMKENIKKYDFAKVVFISIPADSVLLNGYMIRPNDFDSTRKYPVFMYVYGGPSSQLVKNEWENFNPWFQYLTQHGYIIACVDNRGTDGRGEAFRKCTYLQLGKIETRDQLTAAHFLSKLPYIDGSRIGIFGWSYGGFMVASCLTKGNGTFKVGIAVAPVTNWRYYDNIYTERYMRTPLENPKGYEENSPLNYADSLQGNFLLIHGSADDNVHFQNSMMLIEKLVQADKKFDMAVYPNKNHGIYGGNTRLHLFRKMTEYILTNL